jgi:FkbM family methyltransferase
VFPLALGETAGTLLLDIDRNDKGGTRTRRSDDREQPGDAIRVECRALSQVLMQEGIQAIDALKIDVEGAEAAILAPFFRDAPETQWPRLLIIEDTHELWPIDLFAELRARGYTVATRTKQNVMMRR